MKTYIGTKVIDAKPMSRGEYNEYRGCSILGNENPNDEGFLVVYPDGYESWSPRAVFEAAYREIGDVEELKMDLLTSKYTKVYVESDYAYNAPHQYLVTTSAEGKGLCHIHFQEGPIKECGVNGVCNEDLINMVIDRLQHFQKSEFNCRENALAITHLEEALLWLRKRTMARESRGVEGTHTV